MSSSQPNGATADESSTTPTSASRRRNPPFLPTPLEAALLLAYPVLLTFGTLFSLVSPNVRNAPYDVTLQAHSQDPELSPSYFAHKGNVFNVFFVKRGWAWISLAFFIFLFTHSAANTAATRAKGMVRWGLVTTWWILVTQWCFGPAIIDRSFRFTGGKCEIVDYKIANAEAGDVSSKDFFTSVACKAAGGKWRGGHDISGHVFLLVLGSYFLVQEVGWVYLNHLARRVEGVSMSGGLKVTTSGGLTIKDDRTVVMHDGAIKSAAVEAERVAEHVGLRVANAWAALELSGKVAGGVVVLSWWMLLMTAIYFHTWFEKLTGLLVAFTGLYAVYFLPRFVPVLRAVIGLPGI